MTQPLNNELRFWAVAQSAPDAIISANEQGNIIFWNATAERIFGYTEAEIAGKAITELMPPHLRDLHNHGMRRFEETKQPHVIGSIVELEGLRKNGKTFPIELSLSTWTGDDGKMYFNGIIRDITSRKEAERILREYAKTLQERNQELYAYDRTIAHDLKAPLSVMTTYTALIKQLHFADMPAKAQEYLQRVENAGQRMNEMIDQLLKLATLRDADAMATSIEMGLVVQQAVTRFIDRIEHEHITITVQPDLPDAIGNAAWVEEVFANLIGNAIKYKGKENAQPKIEIRAKVEAPLIRYEVKDNGLGIPAEVQTTLFEAFTRAHHEEASGFGLGLSIVHRIVSRLNGQVGVESEVGKGSTFWFTLPAVS